jgi:hypothetical protein
MKRVVSAVIALTLSSSSHGGGGVVRAAAAAANTVSSSWTTNPFAPPNPSWWKTPQSPYASYLGTLLSAAQPTTNSQLNNIRRNLENDDDDQSSSIDLSSYSIKFEKCQYIKQYATSDNGNNNNNDQSSSETVLETKKFVIFRLCPNSSSSSGSDSSSSSTTTTNSCTSSNCKSNYGEYVIDLETYLEATLQIKSDEQEAYCEACQYCDTGDDAAAAEEDADEDDANRQRRILHEHRPRRHLRQLTSSVDCSTCYDQCQNIANMGDYGYADASEYYKCEKVYENENKNLVYYAGAMCSNSGSRIKVGLFTDAYCENYDATASPDTYIKKNGYNVKLSYHLMKKTFVNDECITSCASSSYDNDGDNDADNNNADDGNNVAEICQNLYAASGKCETPHGFTSGITSSSYSASSSSEYYDEYSTQIDNEDTVCQYIANINSGAYDDSGELIVKTSTLYIVGGGRSSITSVQTTGGQKFALTFFVIGTVGLVAYAAYLRQKVNQCVKKGLLERIGGGGRSHLVVGSGGRVSSDGMVMA